MISAEKKQIDRLSFALQKHREAEAYHKVVQDRLDEANRKLGPGNEV